MTIGDCDFIQYNGLWNLCKDSVKGGLINIKKNERMFHHIERLKKEDS